MFQIEKLEIKDGDFIVVKYAQDRVPAEKLHSIWKKLEGIFEQHKINFNINFTVMALPTTIELMVTDEKPENAIIIDGDFIAELKAL